MLAASNVINQPDFDGLSGLSGLSIHGSLNVPIEHHPTIRYMVYNGYYKVMSNIPKMGHLPTPGIPPMSGECGDGVYYC